MANRPIIMTDTTDRILPLAWGVAGGDVNANKVTVANVIINNSMANISVNNISLSGNDINIYSSNQLNLSSPNLQLQNTNTNIATSELKVNGTNTEFNGTNANVTFDSIKLNSNNVTVPNLNLLTDANTIGNIVINSTNGSTTIYGKSGVNVSSGNNVSFGAANNVNLGGSNISLSSANISLSSSNASFSGANCNITYSNQLNINCANVAINNTSNLDVNTVNANITANNIKTKANINYISGLNNMYNAETIANTSNYNLIKNTTTFSNSLFNGEIAGVNTNLVARTKITGAIDSDELVFTKLLKLKSTPTYTFSNTVSNFSFDPTQGQLNLIVSVPITSYIDVTQIANGSVLEAYIQLNTSMNILGCFYLELYNTTDSTSLGYILMSTESAIESTATTTKKYRRMIKASTITSILSFMDSSKSYAFRFYADPTNDTFTTVNMTATVNIIEPEEPSGGGSVDNTNLYVPYNSSSTYEVGDVVYQSNYIYECNTAVNSPEAFDPTKWVQTSVTSEFSKLIKYMNSLQILNNVQF